MWQNPARLNGSKSQRGFIWKLYKHWLSLKGVGMLQRGVYLSAILFIFAFWPNAAEPVNGHAHQSLQAYPNAKVSIKDPKTETIVYVESDGRHVVGLAKNGDVLWNVEVLKPQETCAVGSPVVRHLELRSDKVGVTFCKHSFSEIEILSGKYTHLGSD